MRRLPTLAVALAACLVACRPPAPPTPRPARVVDTSPPPAPILIEGGAARWDEGLPLGNGALGVLVWGTGDTLHLSLDRSDLWDLRRPEALERDDWNWSTMRALHAAGDHQAHVELFDVPYDTVPYPTKLPGGRVEVQLFEGLTIQGMQLDLERAEVAVKVSKPLEGKAKVSGTVRIRLHPTLPIVRFEGGHSGGAEFVRPTGFDRLGYPPATTTESGDARAGSRVFEQQTANGRLALAAAWGRSLPPHDGMPYRVNLCATLIGGTPERPLAVAARALAMSGIDSYGSAAWIERDLTPLGRPWVRLPDARLQAQYDLAAYLYRSAAAGADAEPAPPMPLQGLWTADEGGLPPWKGDYHNDLNTQATYQPYLAANLWEQGRPWLEFNWNLLPRYRQFAAEFFGLEGDAG